jgi:hypothetical protein
VKKLLLGKVSINFELEKTIIFEKSSNLINDLLGLQLFPDWTPENDLTPTSGCSTSI